VFFGVSSSFGLGALETFEVASWPGEN